MDRNERAIVVVLAKLFRPVSGYRHRQFCEVVAKLFALSRTDAVATAQRFGFDPYQRVVSRLEI
jgi:hypothetical protein